MRTYIHTYTHVPNARLHILAAWLPTLTPTVRHEMRYESSAGGHCRDHQPLMMRSCGENERMIGTVSAAAFVSLVFPSSTADMYK